MTYNDRSVLESFHAAEPRTHVGSVGCRWSVGLVGGVLVLCWERRGFNDKRREPGLVGWLVKFWGVVKGQDSTRGLGDDSFQP